MNAFIQQFIPFISKDICWEMDLEAIEGFTDKEIDVFIKELNIEAHEDFRLWLKIFGKCSGGLFINDDFFLYRKYDASFHQAPILAQGKINKAWQQEIVEEGFITEKELNKKAYFISRENETSYYFIYTTDPKLLVWHYCDGDDTFECINLSFIEYLKRYLSNIRCSEGVWFDNSYLLELSTSNLF